MFGLELVGLALALFPLAIELLNRFEKTQVPEFKNLLRSVSNDYEIFRCSLKLILTEDELKLLASASGKSPLPDDILAALRESFDDDITLKTFEENVQEIGQCLEQLQRNLSKDVRNVTKRCFRSSNTTVLHHTNAPHLGSEQSGKEKALEVCSQGAQKAQESHTQCGRFTSEGGDGAKACPAGVDRCTAEAASKRNGLEFLQRASQQIHKRSFCSFKGMGFLRVSISSCEPTSR